MKKDHSWIKAVRRNGWTQYLVMKKLIRKRFRADLLNILLYIGIKTLSLQKMCSNIIMIRKLLLFATLSVATSAMADQKQTVVIHGDKVDKTVRTIAFQDDKAIITFADGNSQTVDRSAFAVYISNINTTAIGKTTVGKKASGHCYTIDGVKVDKPTRKGVYIKDGKKIKE